jgi:hypothetical protein
MKRNKKNTALSKHKKWLYELQQERERLEAALCEDEDEKAKRKERFALKSFWLFYHVLVLIGL